MAGLQRSAVSFRRQGSSGLVWDDRLISGELNQVKQKDHEQEQQGQEQEPAQRQEHDQIRVDMKDAKPGRSINTMERSRSNGGRNYRTGRVSPAIEPPSPRVSACGCCSAFSKPSKNQLKKPGKRRSR